MMTNMNLQESELTLELRDGKVSRGTLWEVDEAGPLLVMVHGLTSDRNSSPFAVGARELANAGLSTYRPDLYGHGDDTRNLLDCDVDTHARDIEDIAQQLRTLYADRRLIALGHSMGGLSLVASAALFDGVVLLDASHPSAFPYARDAALTGGAQDEWIGWRPDLDCYETAGGISMLVSKELMASIQRPANEEIRRITAPLLIVCAAQGVLQEGAREYFESATTQSKQLLEVSGADHCFDNYGSAEQAFGEIASWMRSLH